MAGRKTKYGPETTEAIIRAISRGLTDRDAAVLAGVSWDSLDLWRSRYPDFASRLREAHAARTDRWIGNLERAGVDDWRATEALLDRCAPNYRKTTGLELSGNLTATVELVGIDPGDI